MGRHQGRKGHAQISSCSTNQCSYIPDRLISMFHIVLPTIACSRNCTIPRCSWVTCARCSTSALLSPTSRKKATQLSIICSRDSRLPSSSSMSMAATTSKHCALKRWKSSQTLALTADLFLGVVGVVSKGCPPTTCVPALGCPTLYAGNGGVDADLAELFDQIGCPLVGLLSTRDRLRGIFAYPIGSGPRPPTLRRGGPATCPPGLSVRGNVGLSVIRRLVLDGQSISCRVVLDDVRVDCRVRTSPVVLQVHALHHCLLHLGSSWWCAKSWSGRTVWRHCSRINSLIT